MIHGLTDHLEGFLGAIDKGWEAKPSDQVQVVRFANQPEDGVDTYCSLGLSDIALPMGKGRTARLEVLVSLLQDYEPQAVASLVSSFAAYLVRQNQALLRGDVVGPSSPLLPSVSANSLYASIPVFFDDGFATFQGNNGTVVLVWLLPLMEVEAQYVKRNGWEAFEDLLETAEVNLFDLNRDPVTVEP